MKLSISAVVFIFLAAFETNAGEDYRTRRQISPSVRNAAEKLKVEVEAVINNMKSTETANLNIIAAELDNRINALLATNVTATARNCIIALTPTSVEIKAAAQASIDKCLNERFQKLTVDIIIFLADVQLKFAQIDKVLDCLRINPTNPLACNKAIMELATETAIDQLPPVIATLFEDLVKLVNGVIGDLVQCERAATKLACDALLKKSMDVANCMLLK